MYNVSYAQTQKMDNLNINNRSVGSRKVINYRSAWEWQSFNYAIFSVTRDRHCICVLRKRVSEFSKKSRLQALDQLVNDGST